MKNWIVDHYRLILLLFAGLAVAAPFSFKHLKTDTSFAKFFPKADPELRFYEEFSRHLGSAEQLMLLSVEHEPHVFDSAFLSRMDKLLKALDTFPELQSVQSVFSFNRQFKSAFRTYQIPYLQAGKPLLYKQDSAFIFKDYPLTQYFISPDSRSLNIHLQVKSEATLGEVENLISRADSVAAGFGLPPLHIMGQRFLESQFRQILKQETIKVFWASFGFIFLVLYLIYRSWKGVAIPMATVVISLLIFYAYMAFFNRPLTIMANLFPTLILIVGISDSIHICSLFKTKSKDGKGRRQALTETLQEIGLANFLTSFTTSLGLLSLLTSSMEALQQFGFDAAVGVLLVYGVSILLTPSLLMCLGIGQATVKARTFSFMGPFLQWLIQYQAEKKKAIIASTGLITLVSIVGMGSLNFNNYILTSLPKDSRLFIDFTYFNQKQKGARTIGFALLTKAGHTFSDNYAARQIEDFHTYLETLPDVSKVLSPLTHYRWAAQLHYPGKGWRLPPAGNEFNFMNHAVHQLNRQSALPLLDSTQTWGRLLAVVPDRGRQNAHQLLLSMQNWTKSHTDSTVWAIHPTGINFLMDRGHEHRISNLFTGLLLAMAAVSLVVGAVFKKWTYIWICMFTNLIPLLISLGFMGFTGMEMRGTTSIVFAVGYVIAVDDTLHFLNRFRLECRKGKKIPQAIQDSLFHSGRAIIYTSLILLGGFSFLILSDFGDIYTLGLLTSIILLTACLANLFLAPALTRFFNPGPFMYSMVIRGRSVQNYSRFPFHIQLNLSLKNGSERVPEKGLQDMLLTG